jgi:hypothetical protein
MADYAFLTTWLLESPREPVWEAIYAQERWPEWWRGVEAADEIHHGDGDRVGAVSRMVWRSLLPYRVEFEVTTTRVERPHLMEGRATGELGGPLRVERLDDQAVDEPARPAGPAGLRVEPRLGDGARRRGDRRSARLQAPDQRLNPRADGPKTGAGVAF